MSQQSKYTPFIPAESTIAELTARATILGVLMAMVMGAANACLGLKAGMTIAATGDRRSSVFRFSMFEYASGMMRSRITCR